MSGDVVDLWLSVTETTVGSSAKASVVSVAATGKLALNISVAHKLLQNLQLVLFHFLRDGRLTYFSPLK